MAGDLRSNREKKKPRWETRRECLVLSVSSAYGRSRCFGQKLELSCYCVEFRDEPIRPFDYLVVTAMARVEA